MTRWLKDSDPKVRVGTINAVRYIGLYTRKVEQARQEIEVLVNDTRPEVRTAASEAVASLTRKPGQ